MTSIIHHQHVRVHGRQYTPACEKQSTAAQPLCPTGTFLFFVPLSPGRGAALRPSRLDGLIQRCKDLVEEEDQEFVEEFVGKQDPSILHFLLASGDQVDAVPS